MKIKTKELPISERPYEKLKTYGAEKLTNSELLAILIKNGTSTEMFSNLTHIEQYSTSLEDIEKAFKSGVDCILHLATLYGRTGEDTKEILESNVIFPLLSLTQLKSLESLSNIPLN